MCLDLEQSKAGERGRSERKLSLNSRKDSCGLASVKTGENYMLGIAFSPDSQDST